MDPEDYAAWRDYSRRHQSRQQIFENFNLYFSPEEDAVFSIYVLPLFFRHEIRVPYDKMTQFYGEVKILSLESGKIGDPMGTAEQRPVLDSCLDKLERADILALETGSGIFYILAGSGREFFQRWREFYGGGRVH